MPKLHVAMYRPQSIIINTGHYTLRTGRSIRSTKLPANIFTSSLMSSLINQHPRTATEEQSLFLISMKLIFRSSKR